MGFSFSFSTKHSILTAKIVTNNLIAKYEDHEKYEWHFSQTSQVTQEGAVL